MINVFGSVSGVEELQHLKDVLDKNWFGKGEKTKLFEDLMTKHLGANNFILLNSGSNALHMACTLLDLPVGSEVILPSFTWISCAHAVVLAGLTPVFCDVELDSQNISAATIKPHITSKTAAIMVVHYAGKAVDMQPILDLGFLVIEDAAHAVDTFVNGKACGTFGDIGVYSFDGVKNIAAGEAGGITIQDDLIFKKAIKLRYSGIGHSGFELVKDKKIWWENDIEAVFPKMLASDITAAVALGQFETLGNRQTIRKKLWQNYQNAFANVPYITIPHEAKAGETHSFFTYFIQVPQRDKLALYLLQNDVYTTLRYFPLHLHSIYAQTHACLPNTALLHYHGLNLPLHPGVTDAEQAKVIELLLDHTKWMV